MEVKIKKLNEKAVIPQYAHPTDAGLAHMLGEERTGIVMIIVAINYCISQFCKLIFEKCIVTVFPYILKHTIDIHLMYA